MTEQENSTDGLYISDLSYSVLRSRREGENDLRRLCFTSSKEGLWLFVPHGPDGPSWKNLVSEFTERDEAVADIGYDYAKEGWQKVIIYHLRPKRIEDDYFNEIYTLGILSETEALARNYARLCSVIPPPEDIENYTYMVRAFSGRIIRIIRFFSLGRLIISVNRNNEITFQEINRVYGQVHRQLFNEGGCWEYCKDSDPFIPTIAKINNAMAGMVKFNKCS